MENVVIRPGGAAPVGDLCQQLLALIGPAPVFDLACVGTSIDGLGAFTLKGLAFLASAEIVYYYPPSPEHFDFMQRVSANVVNVNETIYVKGAEFEPAYTEIVREVLSALTAGRKVAYAVQGSPAFHCGTAVRLHRLAKQRGFASVMVSGVSSFELLCAELASHYDVTNVQIYSVSRVVDGSVTVNTGAPCLMFDLGRFALPAVRQPSSMFVRTRLEIFARVLRSIYPPNHSVKLMHVRDHGTRTVATPLRNIEESLVASGASVTMFFPAVERRASDGSAANFSRSRPTP